EAWTNRRADVGRQGDALVEQIRAAGEIDLPQSPVTSEILDRAYQNLRANYDSRLGGFGMAPKFPQPMILDFLLRYAKRTGRDEASTRRRTRTARARKESSSSGRRLRSRKRSDPKMRRSSVATMT